MVWTHMPNFMSAEGFLPDREDPGPIYCKLKNLLITDVLKVDHDKVYSLLTRLRNACPNQCSSVKHYINAVMLHMTREMDGPDYRRRTCAFFGGYTLKKKHQSLLDNNLKRFRKGLLDEHAVESIRQKMDTAKLKIIQGHDKFLSIGDLDPKKFLLVFNAVKHNKYPRSNNAQNQGQNSFSNNGNRNRDKRQQNNRKRSDPGHSNQNANKNKSEFNLRKKRALEPLDDEQISALVNASQSLEN